MANLSVINGFRGVIKGTGLTESIVDDSGPRPRMAGWEVLENSTMDGTITGSAAHDYLLLSGDFSQFAIVDRVGTSLEILPNLLGSNRRPSGQRGFLLHWRTASDALVMTDPLLVATKSTMVKVNGQAQIVQKGATKLRSGHPVAKTRPDLFEPVEPTSPKRSTRKKEAKQ
jgi:hypothetical protein